MTDAIKEFAGDFNKASKDLGSALVKVGKAAADTSVSIGESVSKQFHSTIEEAVGQPVDYQTIVFSCLSVLFVYIVYTYYRGRKGKVTTASWSSVL